MRRHRTAIAIAVLLVGVVAVEVAGGLAHDRARRRVALPARVLSGPRVTVASLRGRPAIVHFWASWCVPCVREAPELARLAARLRGRAGLVGVSWSDDPARASAFVRRHGWRFPVLADDGGGAGRHDGVGGLPTTLVVDADGRIVARLTGPQTAAAILARLGPAVAG